jgi:hypothetical protein
MSTELSGASNLPAVAEPSRTSLTGEVLARLNVHGLPLTERVAHSVGYQVKRESHNDVLMKGQAYLAVYASRFFTNLRTIMLSNRVTPHDFSVFVRAMATSVSDGLRYQQNFRDNMATILEGHGISVDEWVSLFYDYEMDMPPSVWEKLMNPAEHIDNSIFPKNMGFYTTMLALLRLQYDIWIDLPTMFMDWKVYGWTRLDKGKNKRPYAPEQPRKSPY